MSLDNLTQLQKIAIEGEVSRALCTARHDAEVLYRLYVILKSAPSDIGMYIVEIVKNITDIDKNLIDRIVVEVSNDEVPLWIWTDKVIADLKYSLRISQAESFLTEAQLCKKEIQKKLLLSAFVFYCRNTAMLSPLATSKLCRAIIEENSGNLDFLKTACYVLLQEIKELPETDKIPLEIIHTSVDIQNILSYKIETDIITKTSEDIDKSLKEIADKVIRESRRAKQESNPVSYSVIKRYSSCDVSTTLKTFKTEREAEEFIESIKKQFPDILKTCDIYIKETNRKNNK